mmetsp:Transcript_30253/g.48694  ORF Transcript_30253/g.48694 Transcript_30253/m.48694 type:complete len:234 (-) Transcript_30253:684-1385(-)
MRVLIEANTAMAPVATPNMPPSLKILPARSPPVAPKVASSRRPSVTASHSEYITVGPSEPSISTRRTLVRDPRHMSTTVGIASAYVIVCSMAGSAGSAAAMLPASSSCVLTPGAPATHARPKAANRPPVASALTLPAPRLKLNPATTNADAMLPILLCRAPPLIKAASSPHLASCDTSVQLMRTQNVTPAATPQYFPRYVSTTECMLTADPGLSSHTRMVGSTRSHALPNRAV